LEFFSTFLDIVLHLDSHLQWLVVNYGVWVYLILFAIVFCETGLVVTPFLPGDSLLFVAGTLAAAGDIYVHGVFAALAAASFLGDNTNYWIGRYVGPRVFSRRRSRLFNPEHLHRTQRFYDKYGSKMIFLARFMPIVRTFAPIVAGMAAMNYTRFVIYTLIGAVVWALGVTWAGYFLGSLIPDVDRYLLPIIALIVLASIAPSVIHLWRERQASLRAQNKTTI
jgi:membrane-associated protein